MKGETFASDRIPVVYYTRYYDEQAGNGISEYFRGVRVQRGHGFGSALKGLWRMIRPIFVSGAKAVRNEALRTGAHVLGDIAAGHNVKSSLKAHSEQGLKNLAEKAKNKLESVQSGSGKRKRVSRKRNVLVFRPTPAKRKKRAKKLRSIFD